MRKMLAKRYTRFPHGALTCLLAWRLLPAKKIRRKFAHSFRLCVISRTINYGDGTDPTKKRCSGSRTLRPMGRTLCPRNADGSARRDRARIREGQARPQVQAAFRRVVAHLRRSPHAVVLRTTPDQETRRSQNLSQA